MNLGDGQVLLRIHAAVPPLPSAPAFASGRRESVPLDAAGVVRATAAGITRYRPGDRIFGRVPGQVRGGVLLSEYCSISHWWEMSPLPPAVGFREAACSVSPGLAAIGALDTLEPLAGRRLLVVAGTNPVSLLAIQLARTCGAAVTTSGAPSDVALLHALGADEVIDTSEWDVTNYVRHHHPQGVDAVLDPVGDSRAVSLRTRLLKSHGGLIALNGSPRLEGSPRRGRWAARIVPRPTERALFLLAATLERHALVLDDRDSVPFARATDSTNLLGLV